MYPDKAIKQLTDEIVNQFGIQEKDRYWIEIRLWAAMAVGVDQQRAFKKDKPVVKLDKDDNILQVYPTARSAANDTGANFTHISKVCLEKPGYETAGGYKWRFLDSNDFYTYKKMTKHTTESVEKKR